MHNPTKPDHVCHTILLRSELDGGDGKGGAGWGDRDGGGGCVSKNEVVRCPRRGMWEHEDNGTSTPPLCAARGTDYRTARTLLFLRRNVRYYSHPSTAATTTTTMQWRTTMPAACTQCVPPRPARADSCSSPCVVPVSVVPVEESPLRPVMNDGGRGGG